jgi:deoxyribodipyrimidine photo-lyase
MKDIIANRILLLEPSIFSKYPVAKKSIDFVLALSKENIPNIQIFIGEFHELQNKYHHQKIIFKEHPLNCNYEGIQESRDWMFPVKGYHSSFFSFWKKCKKEMVLLIK